MSVVIRVEKLSKRYRLGVVSGRTLYQETQTRLARLFRRPDPHARVGDSAIDPRTGEYLWALRDVSFDVHDGDVVGIIGRNGSGKSTLLKILSHITAPTEGRVFIKGRIASLLEVGTGFHPELTGRENIFLNGSILGMTRPEITRKFNEIVDFSGVEKFIDTPVKRYSSGMTVRLAFAVAAHLEPEILIVDEVLAVGDAAFQQKCLGKMSSVAREGRTILFVSHQAAAVENLCRRGLVLENGRVRFEGTQTEAINAYVNSWTIFPVSLRDREDRIGNGGVRIIAVEFRNTQGLAISSAQAGEDLDVYLFFKSHDKVPRPGLIVGIGFQTILNVPVFFQDTRYSGYSFTGPLPEHGAFVCRLSRLPLPASTYHLNFVVSSQAKGGVVLDALEGAINLNVEGGDFFGSGQVPSILLGVALVDGTWRLEAESASLIPEYRSVTNR